MKQHPFFHQLGFFLVFLFLYLFEKSQMFGEDISYLINFQISSILLFLIASIYILTNRHFKSDSLSKSLFLLLIGIYLISLFWGGVTNAFPTSMHYFTVITPLILFVFSYNSYQVEGNAKHFNIYIALVFIGLAVYYNNHVGLNILEVIDERSSGSYTLLFMLPFFLCFPKMAYRMTGIIVIFIAILISLKRGGIISLTASVFIYFLVYNFATQKKKLKLFVVLFSVAFLVALFFMYDYLEDTTGGVISERFQNISVDEGSGRKGIYSNVWRLISNSSLGELFWGHGWNAVRMKIGISAHNDFLEILFDFGLLVFIAYLLLYWRILKKCIYLIRVQSFYAAPFAASAMLFLFNSLVSHIVIYPQYMMLLCLFWGLVSSATANNRYKSHYSIS